MKVISMLIFFTLFFSIWGFSSYYIYLRGMQSIPWNPTSRIVFKYFFLFLTLAFPLGRILERIALNGFSSSLVWIGSFWFAFYLYILLSLLIIEGVRFTDSFLHLLPQTTHLQYSFVKRAIAFGIVTISAIVIYRGALTANRPVINEVTIPIARSQPSLPTLKIAFISDIHMGTIIKNSKLERMVALVNEQEPDLILLGGDIVDEDLGPVIQHNLGETIRNLRAPLGVFGITGNHEYIGGVERAETYLQEHGITMLRDQHVIIKNSIALIGRNDSSGVRMTGEPRRPLKELIADIPSGFTTIVLDHQPNGIREATAHTIDLILSGHTHNGQIWPLSYITRALFDNSWGYKIFSQTHSYVSSGFGTWGPPVRIGTKPEIAILTLEFL